MSPRRMPTKAELLRLQKLYRTDKRIAETLGGGATEHLIAYWRRKKGIPKYSFPKFSDKEIREAWDRFGDDFHAGLELGISKAAFYNWRRRYKIIKKPEALKLEQLSLELYTQDNRTRSRLGSGYQTIIQKTISHLTGNKENRIGQEIEVEPNWAIFDNEGARIISNFQKSGNAFVWNSGRIAAAFDNSNLLSSQADEAGSDGKIVKDFIRLQKIENFIKAGDGYFCQALLEQGKVLPGQFVFGNCSSITSLGSIGACAIKSDGEVISKILSTGKARFKIPETIRVNITGRKPRGVFARDIIHKVISTIKSEISPQVLIEFYGSAVEHMSVSERITMNTIVSATRAGGAICPFDASTRRFINSRASTTFTPILADRNAVYKAEYTIDVNSLKASVAGPKSYEETKAVDEFGGMQISSVYIGGMANGRFDDLKIAAEILKGKKIASEVRLLIQPVSRAIYLESVKKGLIRAFVESGAVIIPPDNMFSSRLMLMLGENDKGLSTDFGIPAEAEDGQTYFVSPATAAASALTGRFTNPNAYVKA